jgi:hypothetical protein
MLWKVALLVLALAGTSAPPAAQHDGFWKDASGTPVSDTRFRKSVGGFGAWLLVTPDQDWEQKWNTPAHSIPQFNEATVVQKGGRVFVLLFFSNPALTKAGRAEVQCDIEVERPDKTISTRQVDAICFDGPVEGPANNLYLSAPVIGFVGEEDDPVGEWVVRVNMKDRVRGVTVPLETSFALE